MPFNVLRNALTLHCSSCHCYCLKVIILLSSTTGPQFQSSIMILTTKIIISKIKETKCSKLRIRVVSHGQKPSMGRSQFEYKGGILGAEAQHISIPNYIYRDSIPGVKMPSMGRPLIPLISWSFVSHALQRLQRKED